MDKTPAELKLSTPHPADTAILAMSSLRLGNQEDADRYHTQLLELMEHEAWKDDPESLSFLNEVETQIMNFMSCLKQI